MPKPQLTLPLLKAEAKKFASAFGKKPIPDLYGINDGKKVGTYVEVELNHALVEQYEYVSGNAASGIDFPQLEVEVKATSIKQPQSSCPYKSAEQKVFGLGYNLLVFVYEKKDDDKTKSACLDFKHVVFVALPALRVARRFDFYSVNARVLCLILRILASGQHVRVAVVVAVLHNRGAVLWYSGHHHFAYKVAEACLLHHAFKRVHFLAV